MSETNIKIRINLSAREFEVDGDSEYIEQVFGDKIKSYLDIISNVPVSTETNRRDSDTVKTIKDTPHDKDNTFDSFGEYYSHFKRDIGIVDKLLIACYYVQMNSPSKSFELPEASSLLLDQGVKLSNPNAFNKSNISTKKVFKMSGKEYRVSDIGVEYINSLK